MLNERLGYEGLVLLGDAFQKTGSAIEGVSATLTVPAGGNAIHSVDGNGKQLNNVGTTANHNMGETALRNFIENNKP